MIIFMDDNICMTTGGDMEEAYAALWDVPRIWFIISCKNEKLHAGRFIFSKGEWKNCFIKLLIYHDGWANENIQ